MSNHELEGQGALGFDDLDFSDAVTEADVDAGLAPYAEFEDPEATHDVGDFTDEAINGRHPEYAFLGAITVDEQDVLAETARAEARDYYEATFGTLNTPPGPITRNAPEQIEQTRLLADKVRDQIRKSPERD